MQSPSPCLLTHIRAFNPVPGGGESRILSAAARGSLTTLNSNPHLPILPWTPALYTSTCSETQACLRPTRTEQQGHSDLPICEDRQMSCSDILIHDALFPAIYPGTIISPLQAPPTRVGRTTDDECAAQLSGFSTPPTGVCQQLVTWAPTDEMTGQSDIECYCAACEPLNQHSNNNNDLGFSPAALHTGWPLADFDSPGDDLATRCLHIYDAVRASGVPNFLSARLPLPHQLNIACWRSYLAGHSDVALTDFLEFGFPVGFIASHPLESTDRNHASALLHPDHVNTYLHKEVQCQAMLGPFDNPPFWPWCHLNPLMTRPKKDSQDRRVILDLSWPLHASVNGGTPLEVYMDEPYKLRLPTVDDFAQVLSVFGRGTFMWTMDLRRAFRQIRIDPLDWPLICICWDRAYYVNISVAFGVRHGAAFAQRLSHCKGLVPRFL